MSSSLSYRPVIYDQSQLGYEFFGRKSCIVHLANQNDDTSYDDILAIKKSRRIVVPLKSLFNKNTDKTTRSKYIISKRTQITELTQINQDSVQKANGYQINIGYFNDNYWLVFHSLTSYFQAENYFINQPDQVS